MQVTPKSCKLHDYILFDGLRFVSLTGSLLVVVSEHMNCIPNATFGKESRWHSCVADDIGKGEERLGARFVGFLDIAEIGDEIFQDLPPSCELLDGEIAHCCTTGRRTLKAVGKNLSRTSSSRNRREKGAVHLFIIGTVI